MTKTSAINRIHDLLDDNSFVEVGAYITARSTDYNMQSQETPADGVVTFLFVCCLLLSIIVCIVYVFCII